ncbi:MAG: hypothetical protein ACOYB0_10765, partial [Polynucleobacter sp.]
HHRDDVQVSVVPKSTGSALQGIEDRLRRLYGLAGDMGVDFKPEVSLSVDAGDLTGPGTNVFRGRRWVWQSAIDVGAAATGQAVGFNSPTIIERIWWQGGAATPIIISLLDAGGGIPTLFRTLFWRETYGNNYVNENPPMNNSGWQAGPLGGTTLMLGACTNATQYWDCDLFLPGQLPFVTAGNVHQVAFSANAAHAGGVSWGMQGRMF